MEELWRSDESLVGKRWRSCGELCRGAAEERWKRSREAVEKLWVRYGSVVSKRWRSCEELCENVVGRDASVVEKRLRSYGGAMEV